MPRKVSETETHKELIDPQLEKTGWSLRSHAKVKSEVLPGLPPMAGVAGADFEPWNGATDEYRSRQSGAGWFVLTVKLSGVGVGLQAQLIPEKC